MSTLNQFNHFLSADVERDFKWQQKIHVNMKPAFIVTEVYDNKNNQMADIIPYLRKPLVLQQCKLDDLCHPSDIFINLIIR